MSDQINQFLQDSYIYASVQIKSYISNASYIQLTKDLILSFIFLNIIEQFLINLYGYGPIGYSKILYHEASKRLFRWLLSLPFLKSKIDKEVATTLAKVEESIIVKTDDTDKLPDFLSIPSSGVSDVQINEYLQELTNLKHSEWEGGKVSGAVYHGGDELINIQANAFKIFCVSNQLHPDVFPGLRKMESEVISMVLKIFNADPITGCGVSTSGGTESLLLACLSAKIHGLRYKGITKPEMIIPESAHAGFNKASYYFGIKLHSIKLDPITYKADLNQMKRLINKNTVLLVGSAPNFPHGIIDDIPKISELGLRYNIPVHVDCCLGSFVVAYAEKAGFKLPVFDFRNEGVTSISCDTHKYGFAPKGSSILMYRNPKIRECQYYIDTDWIGGLYGTSNLSGSRPGAIMAGCWATMINIGDDGYTESAKDIISAARLMKSRIQKEIPELEIIGDPLVSVISFKSSKVDIYELSDKLSHDYGWHLSTLQKPAALHLALTRLSVNKIDDLIEILKINVNKLIKEGSLDTKSDTAALYGVAGSVSTTGVVDRLVVGFIDTLYKPVSSTD